MAFKKDDIKRIVNCSLQKLRRLDKDLQEHFPEFNVACEYNRDRNFSQFI